MKTSPTILILEDDEDDLFFAERVLSKMGIKHTHHVGNGRLAIDYLMGKGPYAQRGKHPFPDIVLIDLKVPEINGHQVAEWIASQESMKALHVYILSSSGEQRDRERAAKASVAGYFVKPLTPSHIESILTAASV
jgi:CheY-like chemotaxis protein